MGKYKKIMPTIIVILTILILILNWNEIGQSKAMLADKHQLRVHFLDVGQADCILIQLPEDKVALIDGGNRGDGASIVDYLNKLGIKKIDYLIATHPHEDHIGGLALVVQDFDIGNIYMPRVLANTKTYENLLTEIKSKALKITTAKAGIKILDQSGLTFTILAPNLEHYDETNEYSVVTRLVYEKTAFLFMGDAEQISEKEMLQKAVQLDAQVLKIGHHGGRTSSTEAFLKAVASNYAVISVGKQNDYGHPHKEVLQRLEDQKLKVLRTDTAGTIVMISDGQKINIER